MRKENLKIDSVIHAAKASWRSLSAFILFSVIILSSCKKDDDPPAHRGLKLYYTDYPAKKIGVIDLEVLGASTILADSTDGLNNVSGIAIDPVQDKLYVTEELTDRIIRMNLDGSGFEVLYDESDSVSEPTAITISTKYNRLYWANSGSGQIMMVSLDGSDTPTPMFGGAEVLSYSYGLAVDSVNGKLYFTDLADYRGIWWGNADGTGAVDTVFQPQQVQNLLFPSGIGVGLVSTNRMLVWADENLNGILVAPVDASSAPGFIFSTDVNRPEAIAVDSPTGRVYWSETGNTTIVRTLLNTTVRTKETVLTNVTSYGIALLHEE